MQLVLYGGICKDHVCTMYGNQFIACIATVILMTVIRIYIYVHTCNLHAYMQFTCIQIDIYIYMQFTCIHTHMATYMSPHMNIMPDALNAGLGSPPCRTLIGEAQIWATEAHQRTDGN